MFTSEFVASARHAINVAAGVLLLAVCAAGPASAQAGRTDRAGVIPSDRNFPPLWLKSHIVQAGVHGRLACVAAESVYHNDSGRDLEAFYTFPLPDGAALDRFVLWMDGEPVEAKVAERQRARQTYERIVSRMRDPGLLEQVGEDLFRFRIYPVKANGDQRVRIEYSYVLPLAGDGASLRFEYPLAAPPSPQDSARVANDFALTVKLEMESAIATLESPSHKVSQRIDKDNPRKATVSIEEAYTSLDRDFRLSIGLKEKAPAITALAYRAAPGQDGKPAEEGVLMLMLTPRLPEGQEPPGKDVLMVMDTSGSMQGAKVEQARAALCECLARLRPGDRFGLITFSDNPARFAPDWTAATSENIAAARKHVEGLAAEGSTDIGEALKAALAFAPGEGRLRQILFATDGVPTVGEQDVAKLVELVPEAGAAQAARFFTFGIGYDVNTALLDRIAERTRGERAYVKTGERIDSKVAALCDKIAQPVLTEVRLEFSPELGVSQIYPRPPSELYAGRQIVLTARYAQAAAGQVALRGKRGAQEVALTAPLRLPERSGEATAGLGRQWATRKIGYLLDNIRLHGENAELRQEVIRLGTRYDIVTPYTSFLALEKKDRQQFDAETARLAQAQNPPSQPGWFGPPASGSRTVAQARPAPPVYAETVSPGTATIQVPPDIVAKAELGDRFETVNPDRPDTQSALGNPDAHMFMSVSRNDQPAGAGESGGMSSDEVVGMGGSSDADSGAGWGGGDATGIGTDKGPGAGSFGQRTGGGRRLLVMRHGGSRGTDSAAVRALRWLALHQELDGHWDAQKSGAAEKTDTVCTGLALLTFLGAGHTERVGQYKENVKRAVAWLKSKQDANGLISDSTDAVVRGQIPDAHVIAGSALIEAAGMGRIPDTVAAAQKAVDWIVRQDRFGPTTVADKSSGPRMSDLAWHVEFLTGARVCGLDVPAAGFENARKFLDSLERKVAGGEGQGLVSVYCHRPDDPADRADHVATAMGVYCRQFLGAKREELEAGVQWFLEKGGVPDSWGEKTDPNYLYFGTLCVFHQGGEAWTRWNSAMKKTISDNQCKDTDNDGSWDPVGQCSKDWGRVGQTALCALCLEIYYRYLPVYRALPDNRPDAAAPPATAPPAAAPPATAPADPPAPKTEPVKVPSSETGREAVEYSEYLRMLKEGQEPEK